MTVEHGKSCVYCRLVLDLVPTLINANDVGPHSYPCITLLLTLLASSLVLPLGCIVCIRLGDMHV